MDWLRLTEHLNEWRDQDTAPDDGTPIIIDCQGSLGVFAWETRPEILGVNLLGKPMPPTWVGFFILTEFTPAIKNRAPIPQRFVPATGLDEPFKWKPLPERHKPQA